MNDPYNKPKLYTFSGMGIGANVGLNSTRPAVEQPVKPALNRGLLNLNKQKPRQEGPLRINRGVLS